MDVTQAVKKAKESVSGVFRDEDVGGVRLEEVVFAEQGKWRITISFTRPEQVGGLVALAAPNAIEYKRSAKVVEIEDDSGRILSITNRL